MTMEKLRQNIYGIDFNQHKNVYIKGKSNKICVALYYDFAIVEEDPEITEIYVSFIGVTEHVKKLIATLFVSEIKCIYIDDDLDIIIEV